MHLMYIKLVILKILFILGLCNFKFSFKILWPSLHKVNPSPKQKICDPLANNLVMFLSLSPPPPQKKAGGGCMLCKKYRLKKSGVIHL